MSPVVASFPTLQDETAFPLGLKWKRVHPSYIGFVILQCSSVCFLGHKTCQRGGRRVTGPGLLLFGPLWMTPTLGKGYKYARGICRIHPTSSLREKSSSNENSENNLFSHCASAEGKSVPSRDSHTGFKGWISISGNALVKLCCHCPLRKKPHLRKNRVS